MMRRSGASDGFTLVEMLVVLTIMGLLTAIAVGRLPRRPAFIDRQQAASALASRLAAARRQAAAAGRPAIIDLATLMPGRDIAFAPAIGTATEPIVYPDGSSNGGIVADGKRPLATIDWMTGRVGDARP